MIIHSQRNYFYREAKIFPRNEHENGNEIYFMQARGLLHRDGGTLKMRVQYQEFLSDFPT